MPEEEKEIEEVEKPTVLTGFNKVLEILANKISRKAALIALAMVLIYLLSITPTVSELTTIVAVMCGLAVFGVVLQFVIDFFKRWRQEEEKENSSAKEKRIIIWIGKPIGDGSSPLNCRACNEPCAFDSHPIRSFF